VQFHLNGQLVDVEASGTLLDALRGHQPLALNSVKDGCSPQGQCGCCTVWVDGSPRLACVTPVTRVASRRVTTLEGFDGAERWAECFAANGASQCGFCTPGIIMRLAAMDQAQLAEPVAVHQALKSHLCRCTGWTPILEAVRDVVNDTAIDLSVLASPRVQERARLEGRSSQVLGVEVALGGGGFASDTAPPDARYAVPPEHADLRNSAQWTLVEDLAAWRASVGSAPGRRSSLGLTWPVAPAGGSGRILRQLQTTWVEPAYLEPDCSWCAPEGEPASPHANGGAFGGKESSKLPGVVAQLAADHQVAVRAQLTREQVVRWGPKRPPMAIVVTKESTDPSPEIKIAITVAATPGITDAIHALPLPEGVRCEITEVEVPGPPTSAEIRAAGWAELAVVLSSLRPDDELIGDLKTDFVVSPEGATASARFDEEGDLWLTLDCGADPDDAGEMTVLRSYCMGAVHMALGWVHSEGIAVDEQGEPRDLTLRSLGIPGSTEMPVVHLEVIGSDPAALPVNGSDAVFAAVAAALWRRSEWAPRWPIHN
jgi:xanthine dehydrogenase small subunit